MSQALKLTHIHQPTAFAEHTIAWRTCQAGNPLDPYLDPLWYDLWWDSFGQDATLWLLHHPAPHKAYIPMMCQNGVMSLVGNLYSHRQGIAASGDLRPTIEAMLKLLESQRDWDGVRLDHLRHDGPEARAIRDVLGHSQRGWREAPGETELWAIPEAASEEQTPGAHWAAHLDAQGREARRKRRRVARRAVQLGEDTIPFQLHCYQDTSDAKAFAQSYMQILTGSWKAPESSRTFFRRLCQRSAEMGWFRSYILTHHGTPIACQLGFLCDGTYFCYKTAYLQQYAACSPGILVMDMAFAALFEAGLAERIDLLTGDAPYKDIWCNVRRPQVSFAWGKVPAPPMPPEKPQDTALVTLRWTRASHKAHPHPEQLQATSECPALAIAVATGAPNLQSIEARLASEAWQGLASRQDGRIQDVVWLEETQSSDANEHILHLSPPFVRAPRAQRLGLIAALLGTQAQTKAAIVRVVAHVPVAQVGLLKLVGFVEETE